jgi:hypothetical protein
MAQELTHDDQFEYEEVETVLDENLGNHLYHAVYNLGQAQVGDVANPSRNYKKYNAAVEKIRNSHGDKAAEDFHAHASQEADHITGSSASAEGRGHEFNKYMNADEKATYKKRIGKFLDEETLAAKSLHPAARAISDPKSLNNSKVGVMSQVMNMVQGLSGDDLNKFAETMAQFGAGKDYGVGDNSSKNASTVKMKPSAAYASVKEDVDSMFEGQDLSEDFKMQASTLFEAAINARCIAETARLEEEFEAKFTDELSVFTEEVTNKLDTYLDYVVEHWMKENEVAVESTLRNELAEEFMEGLKNLFAEHYINVPQEKIEVLEALAEKVEALEQKLDETISENVELKTAIVESAAREVFEELASDLALTQQNKFLALVEGIEFDGDLDTYAKKLKIVKENYFRSEPSRSSNILEESFEGEVVTHTSNVDPSVNRYVQALARTVKK